MRESEKENENRVLPFFHSFINSLGALAVKARRAKMEWQEVHDRIKSSLREKESETVSVESA